MSIRPGNAPDVQQSATGISGRVTLADTGEAVAGCSVLVFRRFFNDEGVFVTTAVGGATTDGDGHYRIAVSASGQYFLVASGSGTPYFQNYYPGATSESGALPVQVRQGEETGNINFVMHPSKLVTIRGALIDGLGRRLPHTDWVWLVRRDPRGPGFAGENQGAFALGKFRFHNEETYEVSNVPPGSYYLCSYRFDDVVDRAETTMPIVVADRDLTIDIVSLESYNVAGRVRFEGGRLPLDRSSFGIGIRPVDDPGSVIAQRARIRRDGFFDFLPLPSGLFRVSLTELPEPYYLKSVMMGRIDVLENGLNLRGAHPESLVVVIADDGGEVQGAVHDSAGEPAPRSHVVLIPQSRRQLRADLYRRAVSDTEGRFSMNGLAPGEYRLYAWQQLDQGAYFDPDFMRSYENRGRFLQVVAGQTRDVVVQRIDSVPAK
jgi:hypothetical protein